MLQIVRDEAFPFIKDLGQFCKGSTYAKHMKNAVFLIASPALLATVIEQIEKIPMGDRDTKGDLYLKCRMNADSGIKIGFCCAHFYGKLSDNGFY